MRLGRDVDEHRVAAPLLGLEPELGHLGAHAVGRGAFLVDLVDRDDDRHVGRLRVVDGLAGLRLHAVVGGDHDHGDVRRLGAAGTHGGERLVARRVEEGDRLAVLVDLVGADVLGDAAGLARGHLGRADGVQQRRLAVVDVTHDRDDRRAPLEILVGVLERRVRVGVLGRRDDLDLLVELVGDHLDRVVGERLRERRHLAEAHQLLDHVGDADAEVLGDVLDRRAGVDPDDVRLQRGDVLRRGLLVGAAPAPAAAPSRRTVRGTATGAAARTATGATGPAASRLGVDDHAAHATGRARSALALQRGARRAALVGAGTGAVARLGLRLGLRLRRGLGRKVLRARGAGGAMAEAGALLDHRLRRGLRGAAVGGRLGQGLAGQRGVGELLVHGGCGGLDLESRRV